MSGTGTSVGVHAGVALRGVSRDDVARARRRVVLNVRRRRVRVSRGKSTGRSEEKRPRSPRRAFETCLLPSAGGCVRCGKTPSCVFDLRGRGWRGGSAARTREAKPRSKAKHPAYSSESSRTRRPGGATLATPTSGGMMRRATCPKRRSKRCAREGTPRAVSFRECGAGAGAWVFRPTPTKTRVSVTKKM